MFRLPRASLFLYPLGKAIQVLGIPDDEHDVVLVEDIVGAELLGRMSVPLDQDDIETELSAQFEFADIFPHHFASDGRFFILKR